MGAYISHQISLVDRKLGSYEEVQGALQNVNAIDDKLDIIISNSRYMLEEQRKPVFIKSP